MVGSCNPTHTLRETMTKMNLNECGKFDLCEMGLVMLRYMLWSFFILGQRNRARGGKGGNKANVTDNGAGGWKMKNCTVGGITVLFSYVRSY